MDKYEKTKFNMKILGRTKGDTIRILLCIPQSPYGFLKKVGREMKRTTS